MKRTVSIVAVFVLFLVTAASALQQIPRFFRYSGVVLAPDGTPRSGIVTLSFRIYAEQEGGFPLFTEVQSVALDARGRYTVFLGSTLPEGLPLDIFVTGEARWLGVQPDGDVEGIRAALLSVPYALKAADADTIGGKPVSAFVLADDGSAKIASSAAATGTTSIGALATSGSAGYLGLFTNSTDLGNSKIFQSPQDRIGVGTIAPEAPFHSVASEAPGALFDVYSNALGALPVVFRAARGTPDAPSAVQLHDILGGLAVRGYASTGFPGGKGQVMFRAAENWTDSATGTYLQFTTTPVGSTVFQERMRVEANGNVGIGNATPAHKLSVAGTIQSTSGGFVFPDGSVQTTAAGGSAGVTSITAGAGISVGGGTSTPVISANFAGTFGDFGVSASVARGDHAHDGRYLRLTGGAVSGPLVVSDATTLVGVGGSNVGLLVDSANSSSVSITNSATDGAGIYSRTDGGGGFGVFGSASGNPTGIAIAGYQPSLQGWAGSFDGDVIVTGFIYKGGGAFKIDHPLDPENKYLSHSFVESPEMKNIYDGVVVLDETGTATVSLPDWFEALNRDFRYQLTPIGAAFVPYIAEEIAGNQFRIAGGVPGKKVSWMVTGIRQDAFANAHPLQVEELKPDAAVGTYLHPEAFGVTPGSNAMATKNQKTSAAKAKEDNSRLRAITQRPPAR
jgi:hypothetical protein